MAAIRTVADLTTDPNLIGYYDYEEERERELRVEKFYARKAGREEGIKEGEQKGIQEGINTANIEIAKKMLLKEKSVEEIMEFTNLSFDAIENLRKAFDNK